MRSLLDVLYNERRGCSAAFVIALGTALVAATLMHLAEADVRTGKAWDRFLTLLVAIVTIGTIGYGDVVRVTALGKLIPPARSLPGSY